MPEAQNHRGVALFTAAWTSQDEDAARPCPWSPTDVDRANWPRRVSDGCFGVVE
jgi:hypothetical protein